MDQIDCCSRSVARLVSWLPIGVLEVGSRPLPILIWSNVLRSTISGEVSLLSAFETGDISLDWCGWRGLGDLLDLFAWRGASTLEPRSTAPVGSGPVSC